MFDVFYWGPKPCLFEFERPADNLDHAAELSRTGYYWYIYGGNDYTGFDFDYVPVPWENSHLHIWPSQWSRNGGVYLANKTTVKNKEWNFKSNPLVKRIPDQSVWHIPDYIDRTQFDFSWHPDPLEPDYEYHFPTQHQSAGGPVYPGTAGIKLVKDQVAVAIPMVKPWRIPDYIDISKFDFSWHPDPLEPKYEYHFPTQHQSAGGPVYPGTAGIKLIRDQIAVAIPVTECWSIPPGVDTTEFDFSWHPDPREPNYSYQFPTQHQRDGGPVYMGTAGIKYVTDQKIRANATQIFYMDFLNGTIAQHQYEYLRTEHPDIKKTRYVDNHLNVFRRIMNMATTEFVWIISSICDYTTFDFTWHPPEEQREMIHCFPSGNLKRGDTFYIHVPSFRQQMIDLDLLDWFNIINYVEDHNVDRFATPVHLYESDDLITEIKNYEFKTPYVFFTTQKDLYNEDSICLWSHKDRAVSRCSQSGATVLVPRDIKADLKSQIYDYPYIEDSVYRINEYYIHKNWPGQDIVYISNGEPDEQRWYEHLCYMSNTTNIEWVRGVNGRTAAYQEAARRSRTPWFFAVFAKLEVVEFDWRWMPDYFQEPKHYIFNSHNPVNGLEYGHQGIIAYNKRLVLENNEPGIDFTLSQPHESVPILSGIAHFDQDSWMTWRTAFREVVKLKHFMAIEPTLETEHRLNVWLTRAEGEYAEYCLGGARDAVEYYNEVAGDYERLKLSFDWAWLKERFNANNQ